MNKSVRWSRVVAGALASVMVSCAAQADSFPSKMIRATIPFGAGSATDVVPRLVFERIGAEFGQPIVVENRVGGGGAIGTNSVAKAEPDGYSILAHSSAIGITPAVFPNLPYDTSRDLAGTLMIGSSSNVMIVLASRPWKNIQEFLVDARAKGSQINFGSVGIGSNVHISAEKFRLAAGFEATHVPYRGGPEVIADILGGRIDFYFCPLSTALPLIRDGQVRALVVSSATRSPDLPDVPTPAEAGAPGGDSSSWFALFLPSKTPRDIVDKWHAAGIKVLAAPDMQASLKRLGVGPMPMQPAEIDAMVAKEIAANMLVLKDVK